MSHLRSRVLGESPFYSIEGHIKDISVQSVTRLVCIRPLSPGGIVFIHPPYVLRDIIADDWNLKGQTTISHGNHLR